MKQLKTKSRQYNQFCSTSTFCGKPTWIYLKSGRWKFHYFIRDSKFPNKYNQSCIQSQRRLAQFRFDFLVGVNFLNIRNSTAVKHRHNWGCMESGLIRCECDVNDRRGSWITVESITHTVDCGDIKTSLENISLRVDYSFF